MTMGSLLNGIVSFCKRKENTAPLEKRAKEIAAESKYEEMYISFIEAAKIGSHCVIKDKMEISSELKEELDEEEITINNAKYPEHTSFSW